MLQEKIVASCSRRLVIIAVRYLNCCLLFVVFGALCLGLECNSDCCLQDYRKDSKVLGEKWKAGVPLEVLPLAYQPVLTNIAKLGGKGVLRMAPAAAKAGPVVTVTTETHTITFIITHTITLKPKITKTRVSTCDPCGSLSLSLSALSFSLSLCLARALSLYDLFLSTSLSRSLSLSFHCARACFATLVRGARD